MSTHPHPEQLSAYIDGELTGTDRDDLEQHLTGCSDCSATLRAMRATVADLRALPSPVPSEQESWALRAAITKARKRPARLYRFGIAASGVAAVTIAVIVLSTNATNVGGNRRATAEASPTNGFHAPVLGAAQVPATLGPTYSFDSTNYTSHSAKTLFSSLQRTYDTGEVGAGVQNSPATAGSGTYLGRTPSGSHADASVYRSRIAACERSVLSQDTASARPVAYIVGRYDSTPAFFLIYTVTSGGKTKTEMWIVQQKDCYIRLFLTPQ